MARARERAALEPLRLSRSWGMAVVVFACWDALTLWLARVALQRWSGLGAPWSWVALAALAAVLVTCEAGWLLLQLRHERRREALSAAMFVGASGDAFTEALIAADGRDPEDP